MRVLGLAVAALAVVGIAGCAAPTEGDDGSGAGASAQTADAREGFVYFHGMSHLGFSHDALRAGLGGSGISGGIAKAWLDGDDTRSLLLVYGDTTRELGGEKSYVRELANHPRASLCYVSGDHERFRRDDMVVALVSKDCEDLAGRLAAP